MGEKGGYPLPRWVKLYLNKASAFRSGTECESQRTVRSGSSGGMSPSEGLSKEFEASLRSCSEN
jgi:hypothetical protein